MDTLLKTSIFNTIKEYSDQEALIFPGQTIIIGLSGGPDSVFLCHFLLALQKEYSLTLVAAHVNHGWRTESDQDALFCKQLCKNAGIEYVMKHLSEIPQTKKMSGSAEDMARNARRIFFEECAKKYSAHSIALAHHQDDLIETFFMRLIRGAGISGLSSIKSHNGMYIRPLLALTKRDIHEYLSTHNIDFCVDSTNTNTLFLRNAIRHTLMPVYTQLDTRAYQNLVKTIGLLQKTDADIQAIALKKYSEFCNNEWISTRDVLELDSMLQHRVLLLWIISAGVHFTPTENFFREIIRFFQQPASKKHTVCATWCIEKIKHKARITLLPHKKILQ